MTTTPRKICRSCGSALTRAQLDAMRKVNCCPERAMNEVIEARHGTPALIWPVTDLERQHAMGPELSKGYTQKTRDVVLRGGKDEDKVLQALAAYRVELLASPQMLGLGVEDFTMLLQILRHVEANGYYEEATGLLRKLGSVTP